MNFTITGEMIVVGVVALLFGLILGWLLFRGAGKRAELEEEVEEREVQLASALARNDELKQELLSARDQIKPLADEVDKLRVMKDRAPKTAFTSAAPVAPRTEGTAPTTPHEKLPAFLDAEPENPDDLSLIKGIGPKMEAMLHDMGVWFFAQIADWTEDEKKMADAKLGNFKGRLDRDKVMEQAKLLAAGRVTEYEARFGKLGRG
ncbi:MAG: hypothetical protein WA906_07755 [Pacificimonas sp.]